MRLMPIGKVTHVYRPIGCVAISLFASSDFTIMAGEHLLFEKGDPDKPDLMGNHRSRHQILNIQIGHVDQDAAFSGDECGLELSGRDLPPNNATAYLILAM